MAFGRFLLNWGWGACAPPYPSPLPTALHMLKATLFLLSLLACCAYTSKHTTQQYHLNHATLLEFIPMETETASDSLHGVRG